MPDSRVTVPIEDFAQTMRSLFPRYASASDEQLIDKFASENPQCRLLREGANVTLENLSSILTAEAVRQAEAPAPRTEPTPAPAATSSPVMVNELLEGGKSQQDTKNAVETMGASTAISESREQSDANDGTSAMPSFEPQEEKKRPVALWVASIIVVLALCGGGIYYAQHAKVENQSNTQSRAAAPVAEANPPVSQPAPAAQEPQAEVAPAATPPATAAAPPAPATAPPAVVKTDPYDSLPAFGIDKLFQRIHTPSGERDLIGKRIRIKGKIEKLGEEDVSLMGHEGSLTYWFDVRGLGAKELSSLRAGDTVEVACEFTGNRASTGDTVMRWSFHGLKIRKVSP